MRKAAVAIYSLYSSCIHKFDAMEIAIYWYICSICERWLNPEPIKFENVGKNNNNNGCSNESNRSTNNNHIQSSNITHNVRLFCLCAHNKRNQVTAGSEPWAPFGALCTRIMGLYEHTYTLYKCLHIQTYNVFTAQTKLMAEKGKIDNRPPTQASCRSLAWVSATAKIYSLGIYGVHALVLFFPLVPFIYYTYNGNAVLTKPDQNVERVMLYFNDFCLICKRTKMLGGFFSSYLYFGCCWFCCFCCLCCVFPFYSMYL